MPDLNHVVAEVGDLPPDLGHVLADVRDLSPDVGEGGLLNDLGGYEARVHLRGETADGLAIEYDTLRHDADIRAHVFDEYADVPPQL